MKAAKFQLKEHPWIALILVLITFVFVLNITSIILFEVLRLNTEDSIIQTLPAAITNFILLFIIIPFLYKLPRGNNKIMLYLNDIGLLRIQPFFKLLLLGLSCYLVFLFFQVAGSIIYHLSQGETVNAQFIQSLFKFSNEFPPNSNGWLVSLPSILEEFVFRGVILTLFLTKYTPTRAIIYSAIGFGVIHLLNLASDKEVVWVMGQVVWCFISGLFYGYLFLKTKSLLPVMVVHYLFNLFIWTLTNNIQIDATAQVQAFYGVLFFFGVFPSALAIIWTRFFIKRWPI
jgi:membrane protease YdiL (CAAX protease family)